MNWKDSLRNKEYVNKDIMPGVIRAAVKDDSSQAIYLLASVLLMYSVEGKNRVHPLKVIYDPVKTLYEAFPDTEVLWKNSGDAVLLSQVPELVLVRRRGILRDVIEQIKEQKQCECPRHANSVGTGQNGEADKCIIPSVLLWDRIVHLLNTCFNCPIRDPIGSFVFTVDQPPHQRIARISNNKIKMPQVLLDEFNKNKHKLTKNAEIASTQQSEVWVVTDYVDIEKEGVVTPQYTTYFLRIGKSTDHAIEVHNHVRKDIVDDLDRVIEILSAPWKSLAGYNWWPSERLQLTNNDLEDWSRFRAVFFFNLAKQIILNSALIQTDNALATLLGDEDINSAEKAMKECWRNANEDGVIDKNQLGESWKDVSELYSKLSPTELSSEIRRRMILAEGYPLLEDRVMQCVCELIDIETDPSL